MPPLEIVRNLGLVELVHAADEVVLDALVCLLDTQAFVLVVLRRGGGTSPLDPVFILGDGDIHRDTQRIVSGQKSREFVQTRRICTNYSPAAALSTWNPHPAKAGTPGW